MSRRALLAVLCPVVAVALVFFAAKRTKTGQPITPGKDTTVLDGPLDAGGLINYETALNERLRGKTTADTNAVVLLLKAFGPKPEGRPMHPDVYRWLGTTPPPDEGDYLLKTHEYFREEVQGQNQQAFHERQSELRNRPWTAADDPKTFDWVTANEKPLAVAAEAARRPHYFHPLVSRTPDGARGSMIGALLPLVQKCREIASVLSLRVMMRCGDKKYDVAWADVLTMHRLARLTGQGGTLIESLVGFAIDSIARNSALRLLEAARPTAKQALAWRDELAKLPPFSSLADKVDVSERFTFLDVCQFIRRDGAEALKGLFDGNNRDEAQEVLAASLPRLDWNKALRAGNGWYDRLAAVLRQPARAERVAALQVIDAELKELNRERTALDLGERLVVMFIPTVSKVSEAADRQEVQFRTEVLAFALAAHFADKKSYPVKLADLVPKYAAAIPGDLYSGKELIYKSSAAGYELYSVGPNGTDDGGHMLQDNPPGDDIGLRMPNEKK